MKNDFSTISSQKEFAMAVDQAILKTINDFDYQQALDTTLPEIRVDDFFKINVEDSHFFIDITISDRYLKFTEHYNPISFLISFVSALRRGEKYDLEHYTIQPACPNNVFSELVLEFENIPLSVSFELSREQIAFLTQLYLEISTKTF